MADSFVFQIDWTTSKIFDLTQIIAVVCGQLS
jgi:hypothetical protein